MTSIVTATAAFGESFGYTNCHVIADRSGRAIIVDPGEGAMPWVLEQIAARNLDAQAVLLTHGHMDHTWDAQPLADQLAVPVFLHRSGHDSLTRPEAALPATFPAGLLVGHPRLPPRRLVHPHANLTVGDLTVRTMATPGHTSCSVTYHVICKEDRILCTGDTLLSDGQAGTPVPPSGDQYALDTSIARLRRTLGAAMVLPGHGPSYVTASTAHARTAAHIEAKLPNAIDPTWKSPRPAPIHQGNFIPTSLSREDT